jgi:hypothetical protein
MSTKNLEQKYSKMTKLESKEVRQLNFVEEKKKKNYIKINTLANSY